MGYPKHPEKLTGECLVSAAIDLLCSAVFLDSLSLSILQIRLNEYILVLLMG